MKKEKKQDKKMNKKRHFVLLKNLVIITVFLLPPTLPIAWWDQQVHYEKAVIDTFSPSKKNKA
ncbi:MAG: hypothetical protein FWD26_05895 [Treponema sp.]|nr:hypothetical protein [Treponema sp.]